MPRRRQPDRRQVAQPDAPLGIARRRPPPHRPGIDHPQRAGKPLRNAAFRLPIAAGRIPAAATAQSPGFSVLAAGHHAR
jgi:hypothetical protein